MAQPPQKPTATPATGRAGAKAAAPAKAAATATSRPKATASTAEPAKPAASATATPAKPPAAVPATPAKTDRQPAAPAITGSPPATQGERASAATTRPATDGKPPATPKPTEPARGSSTGTAAPPPAAALSLADVKLLRDRLDAVKPGTSVTGTTPADQLLAAMAARLDAARSTDAARIAALEKQVAALTAQIDDLTAKAAEAAEHAAATSDDRDVELRDALAVTDRLLADLARTKTGSDAAAADLATTKTALTRVEREVADLRTAADPKATGAKVLGPETVASLLNDFVGSFTSQLTGLNVASGEVALKAGFAQLGKGAGFVLPTAGTPAAEQPVLHEIRLKLDPKG